MRTAMIAILYFSTVPSLWAKRMPSSPIQRPLILRGQTGTAAFSFPLTAPGAPSLDLSWSVSEIVDHRRSRLTIEVDQRPVRTVWFSAISEGKTRGRWKLNLGVLQTGFHTVKVKVNLSVPGDPCLRRHEDGAWLQLHPNSVLTLPLAPPSSARATIADLPGALRTSQGGFVRMVLPSGLSKSTVLATLEGYDLLRGWGLKPTLDSSVKPALVLQTLEKSPAAPSPAAWALEHAPTEARAAVAMQGDTLTIVSRSPADLAGAVRQLGQRRVRSICPLESPCLLGRQAEVSRPPPDVEPDESRVLDLEALGHPRGWLAKGSGVHKLRFVYAPKKWWQIDRSPELDLSIRLPEASVLSSKLTTLTVLLNERPLGTWHLGRGTPRTNLKARVPEAFWGDEAWSFEVVVRLSPKEELPCDALNERAIWAVVEAKSSLTIERRESLHGGIASFFEGAKRQRPSLIWIPFSGWQEVLAIASLLHPFSLETPDQSWRWAVAPAPEEQRSIAIVGASEVHRGELRKIISDREAWWLDASESLGIPLAEVESTARISTDSNTRLALQIGSTAGRDWSAAPDYRALRGRHALWVNQRWHSLGPSNDQQHRTVRRTQTERIEHRAQSDRARIRRTVNLIWSAAAVCALLGLVLYRRRKPKQQLGDGRDIEAMSPAETGS